MAIGRIALCSVKGIIIQREIEVEVTGNGYIDLTDAVVNKLLELKAYGGCVQASTPTPTTPVDIVCNNGALKVKDKELPVGYVRLASIEFAGSTYYDTDEKLYGSDTISMKLDMSGSGGRNIFGAYTGTSAGNINYSFFGYNTASGQAYLRYGETLYRPTIGTGIKTLTFGPGTTTGFATNVTITEQTFETSSIAYIGALPNSSSPKYEGEFIGNIEVSDTNGTRLKWIPCKRKSDGVIGYYEVVNGNFLEPVGDTPTAGAEDYSNIEVYVEGTKEKIGIGNTTTYNSVDGQGTYVSPSTTTRIYKAFGQLPAGTYKVSVSTGYELIMQWKNEDTYTPSQYGNIGTWTSEGTFEADGVNYYGIAIRYPTNVRISPSDFDGNGTISFTNYQNTATCEDLLGVGDYKDEQEILSGDVITKVGVAVLTGDENWSKSGTYNGSFYGDIIGDMYAEGGTNGVFVYCTHLVANTGTLSTYSQGDIWVSPISGRLNMWYDNGTATLEQRKDYLKNQLSAGTPVIVVYPLATPTTLSVAGQSLSIPAGDSRIEIVEGSILNLPLYAKYKANE